MKLDFETSGTLQVRSDAELRDALVSGGAVRLAGSGSQQLLVPAPATKVRVISLQSMDRILRLESDDLTCTVEAGVRREALDAALQEHRLQLPCAGGGTIGGLFAADVHGPLGPGMYSPRSLLLGFEGMLAEGLAFKAGARVVKSVAGFDLQKLFVGSQGRLFAVTRLHLKLRTAPRHQVDFVQGDLTQGDAVAAFQRLRLLPTPPHCLVVHRANGATVVRGNLAGPHALVESLLREHRLTSDPASAPLGLEPAPDEEILQGTVLGSRLAELLSRLPQQELIVSAGGRFQVRAHREESDAVLASLRDLAADAWVLRGTADRRGRSANGSPPAASIENQLKQALDPNGVLS
ncbi:MAG: FAD-binding oxidoreductase [Planctomycetota bacterium]